MDQQGEGEAGWTVERYRVRRGTSGAEVTALRFSGTNIAKLIRWLGVDVPNSIAFATRRPIPSLTFHSQLPEDTCGVGDWIVRSMGGAFIVMSNESFVAMYEPVNRSAR